MSAVQRNDATDELTPLSMRVIDAIAAREGVDPVDLEIPLYEVIDLDALDALTAGSTESDAIEVSFAYEGYEVHVTGDREVRIEGSDGR